MILEAVKYVNYENNQGNYRIKKDATGNKTSFSKFKMER